MSRLIPIATAAAIAAALVAPATSQTARKGDLTVVQAWARATAPRAVVGGGFLTIRNSGGWPDRLVSASSPVSDKVEIHTMTMNGGVMRMRRLPDGLAVAANGEARLAPGGNHIMFIGLKAPLKKGSLIPVTLTFARAGAVKVRLRIEGPGAMEPAR